MSDEDKYWYNLRTGLVEFGTLSPSAERAGPFDTAADAENAPERIRERSRAWSDDDAADDAWGTPKGNED